jgi:hypothetical protein
MANLATFHVDWKKKNSKQSYVILIVVLPCILISSKLFCQQMPSLLKHKMLQLTLKISLFIRLLYVSVHSDHHQGAYDGTLLKLQSL